MSNRVWVYRVIAGAAVILAALGAPRAGSAAEGDPLLDYEVALVSNYVFRGVDVFVSTYDKEGEAHGAFNVAPAVQPSLTFYGPGGFSFGLWGSWALTDRDPEPEKGFDGLKVWDEVDYTLAWDWENKLGAFSAGLINYANVPANGSLTEVYFSWGLPVLDALGPTVAHYSVIDNNPDLAAATYTSLSVGGGETISWSASVGVSRKLQDVTAGVGYALGDVSLSFNAAYRPNPDLVGPYDKDGNYTLANGTAEEYPSTIAWLTVSYGGSVTE